MFTTKKRKNYMTFIYSAIIVVLCLLIVAIAWPTKADNVPAAQTGAADSTQNKPDTEENIKEINEMATLMTTEEIKAFVEDDYSYMFAPLF